MKRNERIYRAFGPMTHTLWSTGIGRIRNRPKYSCYSASERRLKKLREEDYAKKTSKKRRKKMD